MRIFSLFTAVGLCVVLSVTVGCQPSAPQEPPPPPELPTVMVANPVLVEVQPYSEYIGHTAAVNAIDVMPEVTGILVKINFDEGKKVKARDVLYEIDPVPYQATLDKAKADYSNAKAMFDKAENDVARVSNASASGLERDKAAADRNVAKAQMDAAGAEIKQAEFNLSKTKVIALVDGGINRTEKTAGNLVVANVTKLTRIVSIDPIYAYWDVDETSSLRYRDMIYKTKTIGDPRSEATPLKCWMRLKNENAWVREGKVDYIAREVTRLTASREVRGVFDNKNEYLTPGDSCRVRVEAGPKVKALVVPEVAIGSQQADKIVMVIAPGEKSGDPVRVLPRVVKLGEAREGLQVIESGLTEKDLVVVNGQMRVRPGMGVKTVAEPVVIPEGFK